MACQNTHDIRVIRGDVFSQDIGLTIGYEDVWADPGAYQARMVFRLEQDDVLPELLALTSQIEPDVLNDDDMTPVAYTTFAATAAQTQALPPYDLVYYVELTEATGDNPMRIMQGKVRVSD